MDPDQYFKVIGRRLDEVGRKIKAPPGRDVPLVGIL